MLAMYSRMGITVKALALFVLLCAQLNSAASFAFHLSATPTEMVISSGGEVFVGAGNRVHRLNTNLTLEGSLILNSGSFTITGLALNLDISLVACDSSGSCLVHATTDFGPFGRERPPQRLTVPDSSVALLSYPTRPGGSFYVGSEGRPATGPQVIVFGQYGFHEDLRIERSSDQDFTVHSSTFIGRDFYAAFQHGDFVYFVVMDNGTESSLHRVRILRICNDPEATDFSALYEAVLDCGTIASETRISGFAFQDGFAGLPGKRVIVGITGGGQNRFCSCNIVDVDREMARTLQECIEGNMTVPLAWSRDPYLDDCSRFTESDVSDCNFMSGNSAAFIPALATFRHITGTTMLEFGSEVQVTASVALQMDLVSMMYIAYSNASHHFLAKYHIITDTSANVVSSEIVMAAVILLRWTDGIDYVYAATTEMVYTIPLDTCSTYDDCTSCTSSGDPLCGWCSVKNRCSRRVYCELAEQPGRWIQGGDSCISAVALASDTVAVDDLTQVEVMIVPSSARLPTPSTNEEYYCSFTNEALEYSIPIPFSNSACTFPQFIPPFSGSEIVLNFSLVLRSGSEVTLYTALDALVVYNCSLLRSCSQCVETEGACGWCVYNSTCTGSELLCQAPENWLSIGPTTEDSGPNSYTDVCPVILLPDGGLYMHPVGVPRDIALHTRNLPPPIHEYRYQCLIQYAGGTTVVLPGLYAATAEDPLSCQATANEIRLSSFSQNGTEEVSLTVIWAANDGHYQYEVEHVIEAGEGTRTQLRSLPRMPPPRPPPPHMPPPGMILYDCSELASDCSSCLAVNDGTGFDCGWCSRASGYNSCSAPDECIESTVFFSRFTSHVANCPPPAIRSIHPESGPTVGGTRVTITGTDMGMRFQDLVAVTFGRSVCNVDERAYIPGTCIVCTTTSSVITGSVNVVIQINRGARNISTSPSSEAVFIYAVPTITSVFPLFGPMSGGTLVRISGSALNISNSSETEVKVVGIACIIRHIAENEIACITQPHSAGSGVVQVTIDSAAVFGDGLEYTYTSDPQFDNVYPNFTIPAGGVTLTFMGQFLNVVQQPRLVISEGNYTASGLCHASNNTTLDCIAPALHSISINATSNRYTRSNDVLLNYTVVMDDALGPSPDAPELQISVKPNPVFLELHANDREYVEDTPIRILGVYLDSVLPREVQVFVSDEECEATDMTPEMVRCIPPHLLLRHASEAEVKVLVANGTLEYSVGPMHYPATHANNHGLSTKEVMPIVAGAVAVVVLIAVSTIVVVLVYIAKKRNTPKRTLDSRSGLTEDNKQVPLNNDFPKNLYGNAPAENLYDVIPDFFVGSTHFVQFDNVYDNEAPTRSMSLDRTTKPWRNPEVAKRALPPLPRSCSDEYVEMRSHSVTSLISADLHYIPSEHTKEEQEETPRPQLQHQQSSNEYTDMFPVEESDMASAIGSVLSERSQTRGRPELKRQASMAIEHDDASMTASERMPRSYQMERVEGKREGR